MSCPTAQAVQAAQTVQSCGAVTLTPKMQIAKPHLGEAHAKQAHYWQEGYQWQEEFINALVQTHQTI